MSSKLPVLACGKCPSSVGEAIARRLFELVFLLGTTALPSFLENFRNIRPLLEDDEDMFVEATKVVLLLLLLMLLAPLWPDSDSTEEASECIMVGCWGLLNFLNKDISLFKSWEDAMFKDIVVVCVDVSLLLFLLDVLTVQCSVFNLEIS
ncbi:unnamed protein product [Ambrosiozyma monospora]|uniref:Unnamed protein product n=1 Tax=Ambrosiozyma monospora TaxID=43982 RepID=A0ACB5T0D5_AMBMO|nr:unnamed protein product [Ambrosiozyma monospora]